ncbi:MAG: hypothetical protein LBV64_06145, partial [Mediterranea sp.]|nr:hypothetical protein [Mediterranea sp.]
GVESCFVCPNVFFLFYKCAMGEYTINVVFWILINYSTFGTVFNIYMKAYGSNIRMVLVRNHIFNIKRGFNIK